MRDFHTTETFVGYGIVAKKKIQKYIRTQLQEIHMVEELIIGYHVMIYIKDVSDLKEYI